MYDVHLDGSIHDQVEALPREGAIAFAELLVLLATAPWSGEPYHRGKPDGPSRQRTFAGAGLVVYLILDRQRRVEVVSVLWLG